MSKNPSYTGEQTYNIPTSTESLLSGFAPYPVETVSQRQNVANHRSVFPTLIRPFNENRVLSFLPTIRLEALPFFNLHTKTPRRSDDLQ